MLTRTVIARVPAPRVAALLMLTLPAHAAGAVPGTLYVHADHLGSTVAVSGNAATVRARLAWDPYGGPRTTSNGHGAAQPARFTGKPRASSTGLTYFGARYHAAALGRFLGPDAERQTSSPYAYVGAAPLERVDPDGNFFTLEEVEWHLRRVAARCRRPLRCNSDWRRLTDDLIRENTERRQEIRGRLNDLDRELSALHGGLNEEAPGLRDHMSTLSGHYYTLEASLRFQPKSHEGRAYVETSYLERLARRKLHVPPEWHDMLAELRSTTDVDRWRAILESTREKLRQHARAPGTILPKYPVRLSGRAPEHPASYAVANRLQHQVVQRVRAENLTALAPYAKATRRYKVYKSEHARLSQRYRNVEAWLDGLIRYRESLEGWRR